MHSWHSFVCAFWVDQLLLLLAPITVILMHAYWPEKQMIFVFATFFIFLYFESVSFAFPFFFCYVMLRLIHKHMTYSTFLITSIESEMRWCDPCHIDVFSTVSIYGKSVCVQSNGRWRTSQSRPRTLRQCCDLTTHSKKAWERMGAMKDQSWDKMSLLSTQTFQCIKKVFTPFDILDYFWYSKVLKIKLSRFWKDFNNAPICCYEF